MRWLHGRLVVAFALCLLLTACVAPVAGAKRAAATAGGKATEREEGGCLAETVKPIFDDSDIVVVRGGGGGEVVDVRQAIRQALRLQNRIAAVDRRRHAAADVIKEAFRAEHSALIAKRDDALAAAPGFWPTVLEAQHHFEAYTIALDEQSSLAEGFEGVAAPDGARLNRAVPLDDRAILAAHLRGISCVKRHAEELRAALPEALLEEDRADPTALVQQQAQLLRPRQAAEMFLHVTFRFNASAAQGGDGLFPFSKKRLELIIGASASQRASHAHGEEDLNVDTVHDGTDEADRHAALLDRGEYDAEFEAAEEAAEAAAHVAAEAAVQAASSEDSISAAPTEKGSATVADTARDDNIEGEHRAFQVRELTRQQRDQRRATHRDRITAHEAGLTGRLRQRRADRAVSLSEAAAARALDSVLSEFGAATAVDWGNDFLPATREELMPRLTGVRHLEGSFTSGTSPQAYSQRRRQFSRTLPVPGGFFSFFLPRSHLLRYTQNERAAVRMRLYALLRDVCGSMTDRPIEAFDEVRAEQEWRRHQDAEDAARAAAIAAVVDEQMRLAAGLSS